MNLNNSIQYIQSMLREMSKDMEQNNEDSDEAHSAGGASLFAADEEDWTEARWKAKLI
ncbi:hypothetical protein [Planococcus beigongshangi]|uniref:hypothetical protein n=1 Tax=Planococcus beigongshangi TaxID=2782536 RepID=UPI00193BD9EC|nr:hypothetical protein [Planococcus beigongshangi]